MRVLAFLVALLVGAGAEVHAAAFNDARGQWTIWSTASACRALDRPPADFNYAPFNGLQIVARANNAIGVEVFFWPRALDPSRDYRLTLNFSPGNSVTLDAKVAMGDYMLSAGDYTGVLWPMLEKAGTLQVAVEGEAHLDLSFGLDDISWVLTNLQTCVKLLPKS